MWKIKFQLNSLLLLVVGVFLAGSEVRQVVAFNVNSALAHKGLQKSCNRQEHISKFGSSTCLNVSTLTKENETDEKKMMNNIEGPLPFIVESVSPRSKVKVFEEISSLCIDVFFSEEAEKKAEDRSTRKNSLWKEFLLAYLRNLQTGDLRTRTFEFNSGVANEMFVAREVLPLSESSTFDEESQIDRKDVYNVKSLKGFSKFKRGKILGFVDITEKNFGFGEELETELSGSSEITTVTKRPVLTNLAVAAKARNSGVGSKLVEACEKAVLAWRPPMASKEHSEIVLQVEETNANAQKFYEKRGYKVLFADPSCRRLDSSGILLQKVRTTKICFRKDLKKGGSGSGVDPFAGLSNFFASFRD